MKSCLSRCKGFLRLLVIILSTHSMLSAFLKIPDIDKQLKEASAALKKQQDKAIKDVGKGIKTVKVKSLKEKYSKNKPSKIAEIEKQVAALMGKGASINLDKLSGGLLRGIPLPSVARKAFSGLSMKNVKILDGPSGADVVTGIGLQGTMTFNNASVTGTMYVAMDWQQKWQASVAIETPKGYKLSSLIPGFKALDILTFPKSKFILSSFTYTDDSGYEAEPGLNFVASLELEGPLVLFKELKKQAKKIPSVVVENKPIIFSGLIAQKLTDSKLGAVIPIGIGLDFTKIKDMPKSVSDIFRQIIIDAFEFEVTPPPKLSFTVEGGIKIVLGTQKDPLLLSMLGIIETTSLSVGVRMKNMLDLRVIQLGNAGFQIDWDSTTLPAALALGIPFTGIGLYGQINVGTGAKQAKFDVNGAARLSGRKLPDIVIDVSAKNIHFDDIIKLLLKMAKVKPSNLDFIPDITLNKLRGYLVTEDTTIARKKFSAGFGFEVDAKVMGHSAAMSLDVKHKDLIVSGKGYTKQIVAKVGKSTLFKLSGKGPDRKIGTADDGPTIDISYDAKNLLNGKFALDCILEVPFLGLKNAIDLEFKQTAFRGKLEHKFAGFSTTFDVNIDPVKWKQMSMGFSFKNDFAAMLTKQAKPAIEALKKEASVEFAKVDKKIGELAGELAKLKKEQTKAKQAGVSATNKEIKKTRATIKRIHSKIKKLKKQCSNAAWYEKAFVCSKVGVEIAAQGTALGAQETYLNTLLKPGKEVIKGSMDALNEINKATQKASKGLAEAKIFQKSIKGVMEGLNGAIDLIAKGASIFQLKEASGSFSAKDIITGKLPRLKVLKAQVAIPGLKKLTVSLRNIQFDFKRPDKSAVEIATKLVSGIKIK